MVRQLLAEADRLYRRAEAGINVLPLGARTGIWAARLIYAGIGRQVRRQGFDSISARAHTSTTQKLGWLMQSGAHAAGSLVMPRSPIIYAPPLPEVAFLVEAASSGQRSAGRPMSVMSVLADLRARERAVGRDQSLT